MLKKLTAGLVAAFLLAVMPSAVAAWLSAATGQHGYAAFADSFCLTPQTLRVTATQDNSVDNSSPGTSTGVTRDAAGASAINTISSTTPANVRFAVLKFGSLPSIPAGCTVTAATLLLTPTAAVAGRTLSVYRITNSWTEAISQSVTADTSVAHPSTTVMTTGGTSNVHAFDVTALYQAWVTGPNNGVEIRDNVTTTNATETWNSRDAASPAVQPVLILTVT